ncbi:RNA polymerase sigma factor [Pusillimonas noertemannii]|uniref:RNA polymerase sigma-70 factor (ECF subfamily) n=1 Tax=Pusillimonas noertemannii TaxID=305977 RepID=A0A2U1CIJ3_9BURK|nr:RNA polymerase sigma factor [Pusillimonas noertemannii]NYT70368.1 RNA polymerase sigma factor [Pusillimonas noertemannii]PVY60811.1 RNA polymerase sigma-70 factor (ECF subfamily) [Pusillimonas noertemannii]TFL08582.1 RNA polymerase sigma factor [Pusillimonas noertemannii]
MQNAQVPTHGAFSEHTPEKELIAYAADGNEDAFEVIMRRHNQLLFRTARSILNNDADAEDALQEAYLSAWRGLAGFRSDAKLSTWLVRVVVNEALGRLRRKGAQILPLDAAMNSFDPEIQASLVENDNRQPERLAMRAQLRTIIETRIDLLPDLYRTVFVLRAIEEMTAQEVALALKIPEATVRTRFFRARNLLRTGLASDIDMTLDEAFSFDGKRCDRIVGNVLAKGKFLRFPGKNGSAGENLV